MQGCEIWFVRMDICIPLDLLAVGNKFGKVFLFSLSGNLQSATVLPSSSTTSAAAGSTVGSVSIRTNLNAPADGVKRRKVKSGEEALQDETLNKILTVSEEDDEGEEVHTTQSPRNVDFILPERFECAHPQKPLAVLSHPRCGSAVRQVSFSASLRHLVYGCDDGSIWCWDIII